MSKRSASWVLRLLRYALCLAAVAFLVHVVPWYDRVRLDDAVQTRVRLVELRGNELVIEHDGRREVVTPEQVHRIEDGGRLVPDIEPGIPSVVLQLDERLALLSILIFAPVWFIQAYRLVIMVAIQGVRLGYWSAIKLTFAGNFFNFALPGTTGGDLVKAYYLTRYTHLKTEVVTTVFLDRAIGLFGILVLAAAGILAAWNREQFGPLLGVLGLIFAGLMVGALIVFSRRLRHGLRLPQLAARFPGGEQLLRIGRATVAMRQHKLKLVGAIIVTLILQSIVLVSAAVMAWALGMHGSLVYYFIFVAIGFLIAAIPISPQAIGFMEAAYVGFFTQGGLNTASQAVALALAVRLIQLVWAIPGVLVPLLGAHLPRSDELQALETQETSGQSPSDSAEPEPGTAAPSRADTAPVTRQ